MLKARQPGVSTYVEARLYWKASRNRGLRAFILTHKDEATENLFKMAERYHTNNPQAPKTGASNAKELSFVDLDSSYGVGTAGAKAVGRSETIQLFHGSEVGHWPNAEEHATGILEAIVKLPGSESWLESTANGMGGLFYNMCMAAQRGQGEYELIFIPWFIHEEYQADFPEGWKPPQVFRDYQVTHSITLRQLYWAYQTNATLAARQGLPGDAFCWNFQQEYPSSVEEAFRASRKGSFIDGALVAKARKWLVPPQSHAPLILGCDFACGGDGEGGDFNVFIDRQGRHLGGKCYDRFREKDTVLVASRLGKLIMKLNPAMCFLDTGGGGAQVYDMLVARGFKEQLTLIAFGSTATDHRKYANKRAEMWGNLRDWLSDPGGAQIPDDDVLDGELTAPEAKEDLNQRLMLKKKAEIRKKVGFSPDGADAAGLTLAEPIGMALRPRAPADSPPIADSKVGY